MTTSALTPTGSHIESAWKYIITWLALLVLTGLTFGLSFVDMGRASILVALLIAFAKATIVVVVFMHLLVEQGASRITLAIAALFLLILATLSVLDLKTRFPPAVVGEAVDIQRVWWPTRGNKAAYPVTPAPADLDRPAQTNQSP